MQVLIDGESSLYQPPVLVDISCQQLLILHPVVHLLNRPPRHVVDTMNMYELIAHILSESIETLQRELRTGSCESVLSEFLCDVHSCDSHLLLHPSLLMPQLGTSVGYYHYLVDRLVHHETDIYFVGVLSHSLPFV